MRPIVVGLQAPTQQLSHFIDVLLKSLCPMIPSYIRDDIDFLIHVPNTVPENTILASFDATYLYTNIPHTLDLEAIKPWVEKYRELIDKRFKTDFITKATQLILEENTFSFNKSYRQIRGTAMGTNFAPSYPNLVMGFLENKLYDEIGNVFEHNFREDIKKKWKRYLDDCFIFWNRSDDLRTFHNILNTLHPSIHFTIDTNYNELLFLDISIKIHNSIVTTNFYYKKNEHTNI
ncbi:uncharacterized protein LOC106869547 [Octopus bimaculoides]|uniref:uncharacterized protein LOC106869547 n=1 Tax=Octopus bimaculoides TaxID=37653 RepID=UPI00071CDC2F|nr:uncharacterized protein LOC106869547 [Octopus bimaculoides]|eukprot:XP_014770819.1 PREDICTED: uncharacterized protein LOC106869547 [Octopus bimaculoides]